MLIRTLKSTKKLLNYSVGDKVGDRQRSPDLTNRSKILLLNWTRSKYMMDEPSCSVLISIILPNMIFFKMGFISFFKEACGYSFICSLSQNKSLMNVLLQKFHMVSSFVPYLSTWWKTKWENNMLSNHTQ